MKIVLKIGFFLSFSVSVGLHASDEPLAFFNSYIRLGDAFDPAVADLYFDQALVHAYRVYPHGLERNMELSGVQWKQLIVKIMPLAKAKNDKSTFSNMEITEIDGGYKIKADRYSVRKCYTDNGYYMIVKPSENGNLKIIEEYLETRSLPDC